MIEVGDVPQLLAGTARQQPFRPERAVSAIGKDRERGQFVDVLAGRDDFGSAIAVEIAHEDDSVRRRCVTHRSRTPAQPLHVSANASVATSATTKSIRDFIEFRVYGFEVTALMTLR